MLTLQEIKDKIRERLLDRRGRAADPDTGDGTCSYRVDGVPDGLPCGVGCLILDEHYTPAMEGVTVGSFPTTAQTEACTIALNCALLQSGVDVTDQKVLRTLIMAQDAHDDQSNWDGVIYKGPLAFLD